MFRIDNAVYRYYHRLASKPTEADFEEFLAGLPQDTMRRTFRAESFRQTLKSRPFRHYIQGLPELVNNIIAINGKR